MSSEVPDWIRKFEQSVEEYMEKKKFVVQVHFKAEVEAYTDAEALGLVAAKVPAGFEKTKSMVLQIIAAIPIVETPAPTAATPAVIPAPVSESPVADKPFA